MKSTQRILLFMTIFILCWSCTPPPIGPIYEPECNGMNPDAQAMVPTFDDPLVVFADTLGDSLKFEFDHLIIFDPGCEREYWWYFEEQGGLMSLSLDLNAPLPESYQNDSAIQATVLLDTDTMPLTGFMGVDFDIKRMDTTTVPFTRFGRYKYEVLSSFTTPTQTYYHVYKCTDIEAVPDAAISAEIFYFHKGTGFIAFHDLTGNKNWYLVP